MQAALDFNTDATGLVCGVDEAGRGPLAGPVYAAAVILDPACPIAGLADSKTLSLRQREGLYEKIIGGVLAWSVAHASVEEIDELNILQATMLAMRRAIEALQPAPVLALIDGNRCPLLSIRSEAIVKGDAKVEAISAASILAKVSRDRLMVKLHEDWPEYGFATHSGYPTAAHIKALQTHGPSPHHRRSFAPVRAVLGQQTMRLP